MTPMTSLPPKGASIRFVHSITVQKKNRVGSIAARSIAGKHLAFLPKGMEKGLDCADNNERHPPPENSRLMLKVIAVRRTVLCGLIVLLAAIYAPCVGWCDEKPSAQLSVEEVV